MAPGMIELSNNALTKNITDDWAEITAYRCHVCLIREEDGTFSAVVLNLPGAGSCGDTEEEAMENVREAVQGVIESHVASGEPIPWKDPDANDIPEGARHMWILVNA